MRPAAFLLATVLLFLTCAGAAAAPPPMTVPGQFQVSATGAATYTIPIAVPPGTAGMISALSLAYSSQGGDGIVGIGWSLGGLPSIARCPRTLAQDGVHGSVNYDANDKFCLDGQRLVATATTASLCDSGTGTVYGTEIDSYSRIVSCGTAGIGPAYFKVWTKNGQIMEFGHSIDSRILVVDAATAMPIGTARAWAVNRIGDAVGNYLTVTYNCAPIVSTACTDPDRVESGAAYPLRVDYTGNAAASVAPYNSVRFAYAARADGAPLYQAGGVTRHIKVLAGIQTFQAENMVLDYRLAYRAGTVATRSRLTSVTLCDATGACLPATTFGWQGGGDAMSLAPHVAPAGPGIQGLPGDFDGDGLTDLALVESNGCTNYPVYLGDQSGNFTLSSTVSMPNPGFGSGVSCDVAFVTATGLSPSGVTSLAIGVQSYPCFTCEPTDPGGYLGVYTAGINNTGQSTEGPGILNPVWPGDFNGDGHLDLIQNISGQYQVNLGNGASGWKPGYSSSSVGWGGGLTPSDFDGDGCADFVRPQGSSPASIVFFCAPAVADAAFPIESGYDPVLGDFNGDGKTDVLLTSPFAAARLWLATGTGFSEANHTVTDSSDWGAYVASTGDWNGDGKADLVLIASGGPGHYGSGTPHKILLSTGTDFTPARDAMGDPLTIANASTFAGANVADWNSDGVPDIWLNNTNTLYTFGYSPELMVTASNGIGAVATITYDRLNRNGSFYAKGSSAVFPVQDTDGAMYVVRRLDHSNGLGTCAPAVSGANCYATTYAYAGAQTSVHGRGYLGFSQVIVTDQQTGIVQTANYCTLFPLTGLISSQTRTKGGVTLTSVTNAYNNVAGCGTAAVSGINVVNLTGSLATSNDLNGAALPTVTASFTFDGFGNALTVDTATAYGGATSQDNRTNSYDNDTTNWFIGRLLVTTVNKIVGASNLTRKSSFCYDAATGLLTKEIIEPGTLTCGGGAPGAYTLITSYAYDAFGHRIATTVSGASIASRTSRAGYDALGQFQISASNALGQTESWTYDPLFGLPRTHIDLSGLVTRWDYDGFGRVLREIRPDGTRSLQSYGYCGGCLTYGQFRVTSQSLAPDGSTQIGPMGTVYYDMLSREIAADTQGFVGNTIRTVTQYDANLRVRQTSRPYFVGGGAPRWTVFAYDDLGRVIQARYPDLSQTIYGFYGLTRTVTNALGQTITTISNPQGLNASVTDANGQATSYVYDAYGALATVTDPAGNVISHAYDVRGNKICMTEPDLGLQGSCASGPATGHWTYGYNELGELLSQTDARGQVTSLTYDLLGRVTVRNEPGLFSTWAFGASAAERNVGKLTGAKACTASGCGTVITDRRFRYDPLGRPAANLLQTGGNSYTYANSYNPENGKLARIAYPSGFVLNHLYNRYGYLCRLADFHNDNPSCTYAASGTQVFWTANDRDAELHLTRSTAGNGVITEQGFDPDTGLIRSQRAGAVTGPLWDAFAWGGANWGGPAVAAFGYTFDAIGNLRTRTDSKGGYMERYCYDALNRLTDSATGAIGVSSCISSGAGIVTKSVSYNTIGNITSKSDVGTYSYPAAGSARPHAVSGITGVADGLTNPVFTYDGNGNLTCVSTGSACTGTVSRQVTLTAFNMAAALTAGATSIGLTYDSEHDRVAQTATVSGTTTTTTYLSDPGSGARSEMVRVGAGTPTFVDYIAAGGMLVAQRNVTHGTDAMWGIAAWGKFNWGGVSAPTRWGSFDWGEGPWRGVSTRPTVSTLYFTLDHLGSVAVITNAAGAVTQRLSYDAWGKQRNADGTDATCGTITAPTTRGFTGQEQMPGGCLVNLNARIYDPQIGRFMAPDSIVPDAFDGQSYNRYSYVGNNPLAFTDPTGMFEEAFWTAPKIDPFSGRNPQVQSFGCGNFGCSLGAGGFVEPFTDIRSSDSSFPNSATSLAPLVQGNSASSTGLMTPSGNTKGGQGSLQQGTATDRRSDGRNTAAAENTTEEHDSGVFLRLLVPGQAAWDEAVNDFDDGSYGEVAIDIGLMLGEQTLAVLTFGGSALAKTGITAAREGMTVAAKGATGVGRHAGDSIAARSTARDFTVAERAKINEIGAKTGCHTCGTMNPGTKSGNFVPDHQPPSALNPVGGLQRLYPHCIGCSREQGLEIARQLQGGM